MKKDRLLACILGLCIAGVASADTVFNGGTLLTAANWSNGLPANNGNVTINNNGSYTGVNQASTWLAGSTVTIEGGATLTLANDWASEGAALVTVNDATINCSDDFFVQNSTVVLNAGSVTTAGDDWRAIGAAGTGRIVVNGGTHSSGTGTDNSL